MTEIPIIPETAPFLPEQRLWLNGFLAGYFARMAIPGDSLAPAKPAEPLIPLLILYGSQTGTAEALARRIGKQAGSRGFAPRIKDAADHAQINWGKESTLLIVTSTYGDGDMPDNAQSFWDWVQSDSAEPVMRHLRYSVLALGDRNYPEFCAAGRKFDARFEKMGATRIFPRMDCDTDYESGASEWTEGALAAACRKDTNLETSIQIGAPLSPRPAIAHNGFSRSSPFPAELRRNFCLNKTGSAKEVRHCELHLGGNGLSYATGDALGVFPLNCPELVSEILRALSCTGDELVKVDELEVPLREALTSRLDITKPPAEFLAEIARRAPSSELAGLIKPERSADLKNWLWGRQIVDCLLLLREPLPCEEFTRLLRKLSPRLYSISSSPKAHPGEVHLTVSALRYESHGRKRKGVASTFLADLSSPGGCARVFVQPSPGFKLPADGNVPVIMVGPGTGIAPFRAFLEEREALGAKGRNWLFFGDQKRTTDFLYEQEMSAWLKTGHLSRMDVAFSRDQVEKIYVQHRMLAQARELWAWLQDGAHLYVCGDASRMAKDVDAALHTIAQTIGGLSREKAADFVKRLKEQKRYQRDVY